MAQEPAGVRGQQSTESNDTGQETETECNLLFNVLVAVAVRCENEIQKEENSKH